MSKILITSLGTGKKEENGYRKAPYQLDDKIHEESFIARALYKHYKFDRIFMVGTRKSIWDGVYEAFANDVGVYDESVQLSLFDKQYEGSLEITDLNGLLEVWGKVGIQGKAYIIDYGLNEQELWSNFDIFLQIANEIRDGDELYLDITHSFRSLSLMSYVMLNFISSIQSKNFEVKGIFYGMLEYINDPANLDKTVPIVDLKILFELSEWIKAIEAFKSFGRADLIVERVKAQPKAKELTKTFQHFSQNIAMSNLAEIKSFVDRMKGKIDIFEKAKSPVLRLVTPDIINFVKRLDKDSFSEFQLEIAKWYYENKNYALSYIALAECVITKICEILDIPIEGEDARKQAKDYFWDNYKGTDFHNTWSTVNKIRNTIAHQLTNKNRGVTHDIKNLHIYIDRIDRELKKLK